MIGEVVAEVGLQDGFGFDDLVVFTAGATTVITFMVLVFGPSLRRMAAFLRWWETFRDQWDGIAATPGSDRVPGIPERVNAIDGELKRNGGSTTKDAIYQVKRAVEDVQTTVTGLQRQVNDIDGRIDEADVKRAEILAASESNMNEIREAFRNADLEPPKFIPIPGIIVVKPDH
jgi:peptidoglycan hydrolase CwlO-like protein